MGAVLATRGAGSVPWIGDADAGRASIKPVFIVNCVSGALVPGKSGARP
jgi:hypothetical protein